MLIQKNTIEKLEEWVRDNKTRSVQISINSGRDTNCWEILLCHEKGSTHASEVSFFEHKDGWHKTTQEMKTIGGVIAGKLGDKEWPGLEKTILAALDAFDYKIWKEDKTA